MSGLGRTMEQTGLPLLHHLIQTDAAINEGNSGGPLVNRAGQVIGINTALIPSAHGIGFAIPTSTAKPVLRILMAGGTVVRPGLGISAVSVTPQIAFANDLAVERGVLLVDVERDGPAEQAGLQKGDVIIAGAGSASATCMTSTPRSGAGSPTTPWRCRCGARPRRSSFAWRSARNRVLRRLDERVELTQSSCRRICAVV